MRGNRGIEFNEIMALTQMSSVMVGHKSRLYFHLHILSKEERMKNHGLKQTDKGEFGSKATQSGIDGT